MKYKLELEEGDPNLLHWEDIGFSSLQLHYS